MRLSFVASIASILGCVLALMVLPPEYRIWGYLAAGVSFCLLAYESGKRRGRKHLPIEHPPVTVRSNRDEILEAWPYRKILLDGPAPLMVLGGTLRSFITEAHLDWMREFVRTQQGQVRILVMNPASQGSYLRAREERRLDGIYNDLNATLSALLRFQNETLSEVERSRVEIRKYSTIPSSSIFIKGDRAAYTHYLHKRSATSSTWYLLERTSNTEPAFQKLISHYESIWNESIPLSVPDNYAILFVGLPGTGKTTVANSLAGALPEARLISSKDVRRKNALLDIFSESQRMTLQRIIRGHLFQEVAMGNRRIIVDTNLYLEPTRKRLIQYLTELKVDVYLFHMAANESDLLSRIQMKCRADELYSPLGLSPEAILQQVATVLGDGASSSVGGVKAHFFYNTSEREIHLKSEDYLAARYVKSMIEPLEKEKPIRFV